MNELKFYFLSEKYFSDFPDKYLMSNKEQYSGITHNRPCFCAFKSDNGIMWLIPISSQVDKFKKVYDKKTKRGKRCDTIVFGKVLGHEKAFLIQNMCPTTYEYVRNTYMSNSSNSPVGIDGVLAAELKNKGNKILSLVRKGYTNLVFPNILVIEDKLIKKLNEQ